MHSSLLACVFVIGCIRFRFQHKFNYHDGAFGLRREVQ